MGRWLAYWSRLKDLIHSSRVEQEIDDELRFHITEEIETGIRRGLTPEAARRAALESLGGSPAVVRETLRETRQVSRVEDFRRDARHAARILRRNPGFAAVVIGTLGVAIGITVFAFSITDAWLFKPLRFPDADRLVVAFVANADRPDEPAVFMPYRAYLAFKESARSFTSLSGAFFQNLTWRSSSDARSVAGMRVTPEFFSTFGVPPLHGRTLDASDAAGAPAVVISHSFWQRELGGSPVLGSTIALSDAAYEVVGIMPPDFDVRLLDQPEGAALWTLIRSGERGYMPGGMGPVAIVGRLRPGMTIEAARNELAAILRRTEAAYSQNFNQPAMVNGRPVARVVNVSSLQADNTRTVRATLLTILAAAICLLLIAATNVGGLLLGRGLGRSGEVAVRQALGAGRSRLVRQFLAESLVLTVCGGVAGLGFAAAATRLFGAWNPLSTLPANGLHMDLRVLAAVTLAMAITVAVTGLVPAIRLSAAGAAGDLRSGGESGRATAPTQRAQGLMLVAQLAASMVLLVCAGLLARTFIQLRAEPLGFASDGVDVATIVLPTMAFESSEARNAFLRRFEDRLLSRPGVHAVGASTAPPLAAGPPAAVRMAGADDVSAPRISVQEVTPRYFDARGIPLVAGRSFDERDRPQTPPVVLLNARAAVELFGDPGRAVGQRLRLDDETWREVIGVVGTARTTFFNTLEWRADPIIYKPASQSFARLPNPAATVFTAVVFVRAERPLAAAEIRETAAAAGPRATVIDVQRMPDIVAAATRQPTFRMLLLVGFCAASLLLAAIGVYGLVAQAVAGRRREIAVRMALGAHPRAVQAAFVRGALLNGAAGLVIGALAAVMLARTLESVLYGVRATDTAALAASGLLLLGICGGAAWIPTRRATRIDAVRALRA